MTVTSYAEHKGAAVADVQYGSLGSLDYRLKYAGFVENSGDNETSFTNHHGTLKDVPLEPTLGVSGTLSYQSAI